MSYRTKADEVAYQRDRARGRARYVPAEPVRRKLQQLLEGGVPMRALSRSSGLSAPALRSIVNGDRTNVHRTTAQRVARLRAAAIYQQQQVGHVPKVGAVRRVRALMAMGWTRDLLTEAGARSLPRVLSGHGCLITLEKWREIKDVYDQLSMTPGPSLQTMGRARAWGYAPPLAWDDATIDNPHALPQAVGLQAKGTEIVDVVAVERAITRPGHATTLTAAERVEVVRAMATAGASDPQIGQHLGAVDRTILRTRQRHDIPSAWPAPATRADTNVDIREAREITGCDAASSAQRAPSGDDRRVIKPPVMAPRR